MSLTTGHLTNNSIQLPTAQSMALPSRGTVSDGFNATGTVVVTVMDTVTVSQNSSCLGDGVTPLITVTYTPPPYTVSHVGVGVTHVVPPRTLTITITLTLTLTLMWSSLAPYPPMQFRVAP